MNYGSGWRKDAVNHTWRLESVIIGSCITHRPFECFGGRGGGDGGGGGAKP